jgi:ADP-ribose pyrophosphatase YjhB (NUDIX family)
MLKIKPPNYKFCPFCGQKLVLKSDGERLRKHCSVCRWTYYPREGTSVGAVILRGQKVLMVKRNREPYKGTWMFPAGYTEFGEHPEESLKREVKEETGLKVTGGKLIKVFQAVDDISAPGHFIFFYSVKVSGELKNGDPNENQEVAWQDINKLPKIGWKIHQKVAKMLFKTRRS